LAAALRHPRRDRLAQRRKADDCGIASAVVAQRGDGRLDDYFRRLLVGITDSQEDDVLARLLPPPRLDMDGPGIGAVSS
jgi:hypothetical protein